MAKTLAQIPKIKFKVQNISIQLLLNVKISTTNHVLNCSFLLKCSSKKYPNGKISPNLVTLVLKNIGNESIFQSDNNYKSILLVEKLREIMYYKTGFRHFLPFQFCPLYNMKIRKMWYFNQSLLKISLKPHRSKQAKRFIFVAWQVDSDQRCIIKKYWLMAHTTSLVVNVSSVCGCIKNIGS